jgi:hypothetical protein
MKKMKMSQVRCGAINPYALLASRTGKKISPNKSTPDRVRQKFEDEFEMPFHHLFDPVHGSPLFACNKQAPSAGSGKNIETGEVVARCGAAVSGWAPFNGKFLPASPADINDTNQGCSLNCWFVAALASVAWIWPDLIKNWNAANKPNILIRLSKANPIAGTAPPYMPPPGNLWDQGCIPVAQSQICSYSLPYSAAGAGNYVYASPKPTAPGTLWPALMEKSYAEFYQLNSSANDTPDISTFGTGNPLNPLIHLTGKRYYCQDDVKNAAAQGVVLTESAFFMTEFPDAKSVFNTIYSKCYTPNGANPAIIATPMVAWTYTSADKANAASGVNSVNYSNDAIVAMHCYSVLGVHNAEGKNYIVLRNPWGMSLLGGAGQDPDITDDSVISSYTGTAANSIWTVNLPVSSAATYNSSFNNAVTRTIDLRDADGIFAIAPDAFRLYFQGFGWAY